MKRLTFLVLAISAFIFVLGELDNLHPAFFMPSKVSQTLISNKPKTRISVMSCTPPYKNLGAIPKFFFGFSGSGFKG